MGDRERIADHLAPVCVHPDFQKQGIGSQLIRGTLAISVAVVCVVATSAQEKALSERPVVPEDFATLIRSADRIVVLSGIFGGGEDRFEIEDRKIIDQFAEAGRLEKPENRFHCMYMGTE